MRALCGVSSIRCPYPHCSTGGRITGGKKLSRRSTRVMSCKEVAASSGDSVALEGRRRLAGLEFPFAALPQKIARKLRKAGGIIDPADPDVVGSEPLCPSHLVRQRRQRDDHGALEAERAVEHTEDVGRIRFPDRHVEEDHLGFEPLAELLHV